MPSHSSHSYRFEEEVKTNMSRFSLVRVYFLIDVLPLNLFVVRGVSDDVVMAILIINTGTVVKLDKFRFPLFSVDSFPPVCHVHRV